MHAALTDLRARDVMTRDPICVETSTNITTLADTLESNEISGVPVVDSFGELVGVISKSDIIRGCAEGLSQVPPKDVLEMFFAPTDAQQGISDLEEAGEGIGSSEIALVDEFMTPEPMSVGPEESVAVIARRMHDRQVHRAVVVDENNIPIGIITSMDLVKVLADLLAIPSKTGSQKSDQP